ncbi:unnamed protein product [Aphanomyces euteiches]
MRSASMELMARLLPSVFHYLFPLILLASTTVASLDSTDFARAPLLQYDDLYASILAFDKEQVQPKPLPETQNVNVWLGGLQYKSSMTFPATNPRMAAASGRGRHDVLSNNPSSSASTMWRVRSSREFGFGDTQIVRISPSGLDFGTQETCLPALLSVEITYVASADEDDDEPFWITGVSIPDNQFLLSDVFSPRLIKPGESTTFHILYLPRQTGPAHATVMLQTSLGDIPYHVRGHGVLNKYRIQEYTATIPAGVRFDPLLHLHNPFDEDLHIKEIFTTEDFVHMSLPLNTSTGLPPRVWVLDPLETKPVVQLHFLSATPGHYNAYVRIETDHDNLIVPVYLIVLAEGLHLDVGGRGHSSSSLDFGFLIHDDEEHSISVDFVNTASVPILVQGVSLQAHDHRIAVVIQGSHSVAPRSRIKHAMVVSYQSSDTGTFQGLLTVHTNDTVSGDLSLPYSATRLVGGLIYSPSQVVFSASANNSLHEIILTNSFSVPVALEDIAVTDAAIVALHNFTQGAVAGPGASWPPILIERPPSPHDNIVWTTSLLVETNISRHAVPVSVATNLLVVNGSHRLVQKSQAEFTIEFGKTAMSGVRHEAINMTNLNPVAISIAGIESNDPSIQLSIERMQPNFAASIEAHEANPDSTSAADAATGEDDLSNEIPPGHTLTLIVHVTPTSHPTGDLSFTIFTQHESIRFHVQYIPVQGTVAPTRRKLRTSLPLFPGRGELLPLVLESTFDHPVPISAIRVSDRRVQIISQAVEVAPHGKTTVAQLLVSPAYALGCASRDKFADCMFPLPIGHKPATLSGFGEPVTSADVAAHYDRVQRLSELQAAGHNAVDIKVMVYTDIVAIPPVIIRMSIDRPVVMTSSTVEMPLTHVNQTSEAWVSVMNPSNITIDVALALDKDDSREFYSCLSPTSSPSLAASCRRDWEANRCLSSPGFFIAAVDKVALPPGESTLLGPIVFAPKVDKEYVGRLYLRNTLSHIEPITIRARGGHGRAVVVQNEPILSRGKPELLTIANQGELPLEIFGIQCDQCLDCDNNSVGFCVTPTTTSWPKTLGPGAATSINISYVSSCYVSQEQDKFVLATSSGVLNVTLFGFVADPTKECLGWHRYSWTYKGFCILLWSLCGVVTTHILVYTIQSIVVDLRDNGTTPECDFGYHPRAMPAKSKSLAIPIDTPFPESLERELDALEADVVESFTFAPIRSPAVQRLLNERTAKAKPVVKKKKPKKDPAIVAEPEMNQTIDTLPPLIVEEEQTTKHVEEPVTTPKEGSQSKYVADNDAGSSSDNDERDRERTETIASDEDDDEIVVIRRALSEPLKETIVEEKEMALVEETTKVEPKEGMPTEPSMEHDVVALDPPLEVVDEGFVSNDVDDEADEDADVNHDAADGLEEHGDGDIEATDELKQSGNGQDVAVDDVEASEEDDDEDDSTEVNSGDDEAVVDNIPRERCDNTILLEEIDQLMQEVHSEQLELASAHAVLPSQAPLVKAPPGFSPADADPLAVSRTYSHMQEQAFWESNPFDAPLSLFGSAYFTGNSPGFIGSHRFSNLSRPGTRLFQHDSASHLASLGGQEIPFETSTKLFLDDEAARGTTFW